MDDKMKLIGCIAICLIVTLLTTGWALDSFSKTCINIDNACVDGSDKKKQLQTASSGVLAAAAGIAFIFFVIITCMYFDEERTKKLFGFGFGNSSLDSSLNSSLNSSYNDF
jgi:hypothetical protein